MKKDPYVRTLRDMALVELLKFRAVKKQIEQATYKELLMTLSVFHEAKYKAYKEAISVYKALKHLI